MHSVAVAHPLLLIASLTISAVVSIWALVDACNRESAAHRTTWVSLLAASCSIALFVGAGGLFFAATIGFGYLFQVRSKIGLECPTSPEIAGDD
jgi:hypothetical protein